jgi:hypothetical protein
MHSLLGAILSASAACGGGDAGSGNENELITTVTLTFTPAGGGAAIAAAFRDPDGDGGSTPTVDPVQLAPGMYGLAVRFANELESPPEDITTEVMDESDEHQIFFTGTAVNGPASDRPGAPLAHAYADTDTRGFPIGLANTITATTGTGDLIATLRHVPPVNDATVKSSDLASQVRASGFAAIGGSTDVQVTFPVTVP